MWVDVGVCDHRGMRAGRRVICPQRFAQKEIVMTASMRASGACIPLPPPGRSAMPSTARCRPAPRTPAGKKASALTARVSHASNTQQCQENPFPHRAPPPEKNDGQPRFPYGQIVRTRVGHARLVRYSVPTGSQVLPSHGFCAKVLGKAWRKNPPRVEQLIKSENWVPRRPGFFFRLVARILRVNLQLYSFSNRRLPPEFDPKPVTLRSTRTQIYLSPILRFSSGP